MAGKLKLVRLNRECNTKPIMTIVDKGLISFTGKACALLGLPGEGNKISFYQHPDNPDDWYIQTGPDCLSSVRRVGKSGAYGFSSRQLVRQIKDSLRIRNKEYCQFPIQAEPLEDPELGEGKFYFILTTYREPEKWS